MLNLKSYLLLIISALGLLMACADENPNLVNPPSQYGTVSVRFLNFAGDKQSRTLVLDGTKNTGPISWGACSAAITPPSDSSVFSVLLNGNEDYRLNRKIRFVRNGNYTVFALPSGARDSIKRPMDTLIVSATTTDQQTKINNSKIKFINVINDSSTAYTFTLGCPNGMPFIENVNFLTLSTQYDIRSNGVAISILRKKDYKTATVGLFNFNLKPNGQYIVIVSGTSGNEEILLLDEFDKTVNCAYRIMELPERQTSIRGINLGEKEISLKAINKDTIIDVVQSNWVGNYKTISACESQVQDTLGAIVEGELKSKIVSPLEVLERYTFLTVDSASKPAYLSLLIKPLRLDETLKGRAVVRVINAAWNRSTVTISLGARKGSSGDTSFHSGELLSSCLSYGGISAPVLIQPGAAPITVFTNTQPANLLYSGFTKLEAEQNYLLVLLSDNKTGADKLVLIKESDESIQSPEVLPGMFTQIANGMAGAGRISVDIDNLLSKASLDFGMTLATVLPNGSQEVRLQNKSVQIAATSASRCLIVGTGTASNPDAMSMIYDALPGESGGYQRRFINACKDLEMMNIKVNLEKSPPIVERLKYGMVTNPELVTLDRKISLIFINTNTDSTIYRTDDIYLPFNKAYTFILGGSQATKTYSVAVIQEY